MMNMKPESYEKEVVFYEKCGKMRRFRVTTSNCEPYVVWAAAEVGGEYWFEEPCKEEDDEWEAFRKLQIKVVSGVNRKSLTELKNSSRIRNVIFRDGRQFVLKDSGIVRIKESFAGDLKFVIDGILISAEEMINLMSEYCNFYMEFEFRDFL